MFRRKTDQVYATLQQVQRRLSHVNEDSQSASSRSRRSTGKVSRSSPMQPQVSEEVMRSFTQSRQDALIQTARRVTEDLHGDSMVQGQEDDSPGGADAQRLAAAKLARRQGGLQLSWANLGTISSLVLILWVGSLVLVWEIAAKHHSGPERQEPAAESLQTLGNGGARKTVSQETGPGRQGPPPLGRNHVAAAGANLKFIVLKSVGTYSTTAEERFRTEAQELNQQAIDNKIKPFFGVRRPSTGGLQLVYGETKAGVFGLPADDVKPLLEMFRKRPPNGPGYIDAFIR